MSEPEHVSDDDFVSLDSEHEHEAASDVDSVPTTEEDSATEPEPEAPEEGFGCKHYRCRCSIRAPCCNNRYNCRICHNENEDHEVDRFKIEKLICSNCDTEQSVAAQCVKCNEKFGNYTCLICRLFDFTDKKQWHCEGCGICRVGGKENFYHCDTCGYCLATSLKNSHRCVERASKNVCSICYGDLHNSREPLNVPKCGHPL